jgi:hypothetical protein
MPPIRKGNNVGVRHDLESRSTGFSSMSTLKLEERILFLSADPRVVEAQLGGADLE